MSKKNILLLFGGESSEHEVSIMSAKNVFSSLDSKKYNVLPCYITKSGKWHTVEGISPDSDGSLVLINPGNRQIIYSDKAVEIDVMFPVLHGQKGEDGTVQGLASMAHIPCVGPGVLDAAVTIDKKLTKRILRDIGIPVVLWVEWNVDSEMPKYERIANDLSCVDLFVKPATAGSSVGVTQVASQGGLEKALQNASQYSDTVLIEKSINAREIESAVMGYGNDIKTANALCEILSDDGFYDYSNKYGESSKSRVEIPAQLDESTKKSIFGYAKKAYQTVGCKGMARVDFFVDKKTDEIYLNEINSIPGFTNISAFPKMWQASGLDYGQLLDNLIDDAIKYRA